MNNKVLLVGVGYMGIEFAKALRALGKDFIAVGRSEKSALEFEKEIGVKPVTGGLDKYLKESPELSSAAIVAISEEQLGSATLKLLKSGIKKNFSRETGRTGF